MFLNGFLHDNRMWLFFDVKIPFHFLRKSRVFSGNLFSSPEIYMLSPEIYRLSPEISGFRGQKLKVIQGPKVTQAQ